MTSDHDSRATRAVKGTAWVLGLKIGGRALALARILILANLLEPYDFGIVGIALLCIEITKILTRTGFETALIQRKGDILGFMDSFWVVSLVRGLVLCPILCLLAPYIAMFFKEPAAVPAVRVVACALLLHYHLLDRL